MQLRAIFDLEGSFSRAAAAELYRSLSAWQRRAYGAELLRYIQGGALDAATQEMLRQGEVAYREAAQAVGAQAMGAGAAAGALRIDEMATLAGVQGITFDQVRLRMAVFVAQRSADLVTNSTRADQLRIRELIGQSLRDGESRDAFVRRLAAELEATIGLDVPRSRALLAYQAELDGYVAAGRLTPRGAKKAIEQYRRRLLKARAETIAQTEINTAVNAATMELWNEARGRGHLAGYVKTWVAILRDGRVCETCHGMHGQRRQFHQPFSTPRGPQRAPDLHVKGRCQMALELDGAPLRHKQPYVVPKRGPGLRPMVRLK